jgi:hypothetical protein
VTDVTPFRLGDDRFSTQKALQTVVAGQQAENLLDFDDGPSNNGRPSGLAATEVLSTTPAAAGLLSGTSANPLDDLVSIFGGAGGLEAGKPHSLGVSYGGSGFGPALSPLPPQTPSSLGPSFAVPPAQSQKPQEDLLGLF